jgi:secreted PhoX family phosphatase
MPDRRAFLAAAGGAVAAGFLGLARAEQGAARAAPGLGPLRADPQRVLDLPEGYRYRVMARAGDTMSDGLRVPGMADGMGAFPAPGGRVRLVCNHELSADRADRGHALGGNDQDFALRERLRDEDFYDAGRGGRPSLGGTTSLLYAPETGQVERQVLSLIGTERNCAGGVTPWGSWLSCEESTERAGDRALRDHGYVFEVPAAATGPVAPLPLRELGRFNHEAAAVDPRTGIVYLTEDRPDGLFYRFLPEVPGALHRGGRLQALALKEVAAADLRNWQGQPSPLAVGATAAVRWVDLDDVEAPQDDLRQRGHAAGAALFARGEGLWYGGGHLYFACTSGGAAQLGQVFRYRPAPDGGRLGLMVESRDAAVLAHADNLTVAPWGDLILCEDTDGPCGLVGVQPDGGCYRFARNAYDDSELAGACFAPDGRTLFVNIQTRGLSLAIHGPFPRV